MSIIPFPTHRTVSPAASTDVSALLFVLSYLPAELQDMHPRKGETLAEYHARRDAALDLMDELLHEFAADLDEVEALGGAA